jgi:glycosyltransferase involved in cell wall biosynthesis
MNILYLCAFCPDPVTDGDKVRAKWTLSQLARRHRVFGFFLDPGGRGRLAPDTRGMLAAHEAFPVGAGALARGVLSSLVGGRSVHAYAFRSPAAVRRLEGLLARWPVEAAFVHRLRMMPYAEGLGLDYALDLTDSLARYYRKPPKGGPARRAYSCWERGRLGAYEKRTGNRARVVFAVSEGEAREMRAEGIERPVISAPNGVDCAYWGSVRRRAGASRVGFMANLGYPPNREGLEWFAREVAPRSRLLDRPVMVIGGGLPGSLAGLCGPHGPVFEFRGYLPDPRPLFASMAAFVCPLPYAMGVQNKALDAMASGVPLVATSAVARGLGASPGRHLLTGDSGAAFAAALDRVLGRPGPARAMASRAAAFVRAVHGIPAASRALEAGMRVLERAVEGR